MTKSWRDQQLAWFDEPVIIQQDQELIDYIQHNHIQSAKIHGDDGYFSTYVSAVDDCKVDFIIWIENQLFDFADLVIRINHELQTTLNHNGVLYLAVNKFLCQPGCYDTDLLDNYDDAITQYLNKHINANLTLALPDYNTTGDRFYWAHPLTRFYFKK
jgi:hypothetical protein